MTRRERNDPPRPRSSHAQRGVYLGGPLDGQLAPVGFLWARRRPDGTAGDVDRQQPHYVLVDRRVYLYTDPLLNP